MSIYGNMVGGATPIQTVTIVDSDNNELIGVVVENEVLFTATDKDVREGKIYAGNDGVSVGTLKINSICSPEILSCTFIKTADDQYTLSVNGLNASARHFVIVSCKKALGASFEDIIMLRRDNLDVDFKSSVILSAYDTSRMYNIGDNQIEVFINSGDVQEFIVTAC